ICLVELIGLLFFHLIDRVLYLNLWEDCVLYKPWERLPPLHWRQRQTRNIMAETARPHSTHQGLLVRTKAGESTSLRDVVDIPATFANLDTYMDSDKLLGTKIEWPMLGQKCPIVVAGSTGSTVLVPAEDALATLSGGNAHGGSSTSTSTTTDKQDASPSASSSSPEDANKISPDFVISPNDMQFRSVTSGPLKGKNMGWHAERDLAEGT
ncbi:unnamed protein product, partial [Amoebophrya sp. A25]